MTIDQAIVGSNVITEIYSFHYNDLVIFIIIGLITTHLGFH